MSTGHASLVVYQGLTKTGHWGDKRETCPHTKVLQNQGDRQYMVKLSGWGRCDGLGLARFCKR
jgi:hypothetical protein